MKSDADPPRGTPLVKAGPARKRLSTEAWVAIGAIGAALVTGMVTLLVHLTPPAEPPSISGPDVPLTTSAPPNVAASAIDAMVGKWEGAAQDSNGTSFQIMLEVKAGCALGQLCGSIGVSHVPCYGQVFLEHLDNNEAEFRVANFDDKSDRAVCQPGAGERFRSQPDGTLAYRTTYEPAAQGILKRVPS